LISLLAKNKKSNGVVYNKDELPKIAIVFAAYNEEKVIVAKMRNLNTLNYPSHLLDIHIGLDHPDDKTASLIEQEKGIKFPVYVHHFKERAGKANVLNKLFSYSLEIYDYQSIIMMDANIISKENILFELVKHFKNPEIGLVAAVIENTIRDQTEVAKQEKFYIHKESQMKVDEGLVFESTIGAFGACYAIRPEHIKIIPTNFLMEDFYLSMHVLELGSKCITNSAAIVYEDLPGSLSEEFKRKRRISTGNFQNLKVYLPILWKSKFRVAFPFFSHKIIRWLSPGLIFISILISSLLYILNSNSTFNKVFFFLMLFNLFLPILDIVLTRMNINVNLLRLHRYFICMNFAMFLGFIDWVNGVKTNIWKPTKRL
jgi:cellulose synthase/poly-beta-1,6-N-acetylglucosamine synthase-like glycosyltransferase